MLPQKLHIIPVLNDSMLYRVSEFEHTSFTAAYIITHVDFRLIVSTRNYNFVFWSANTELLTKYTDGMT